MVYIEATFALFTWSSSAVGVGAIAGIGAVCVMVTFSQHIQKLVSLKAVTRDFGNLILEFVRNVVIKVYGFILVIYTRFSNIPANRLNGNR